MPGNNARNTTLGFALAGAGAILFATKGVFSKALWASGVDYLTVTALRAADDAVVWKCPKCEAEGRISKWQGTLWDLTARPQSSN